MNGPWSGTARAWTAVPAAWDQGGEVAVAAVAVGMAGAELAVPAAAPVALAHPACAPGTAVARPGTAATVSTATATGLAVLLGANVEPGLGLAEESGPAGTARLALGGQPAQAMTAVVAPAGPVPAGVTPGPCLAGTGRREVARLSSPPTTVAGLFSPVCLTHGLRSAIDIEQT
ncbi:hypothetical protein DVDV_2171 [Desulfovibrio sp. DV]|uniref:hypothetical protein n=1 Tax=Desulfovibrio sp. DV TaxID=1844708 RepID=UPI00094BAD64|nr:hypothetical protein [Desulfovibrio sp. DV]OLN27373.1 hypothetical protein DVDV_2171 [Desulfovibrio sp. DV]